MLWFVDIFFFSSFSLSFFSWFSCYCYVHLIWQKSQAHTHAHFPSSNNPNNNNNRRWCYYCCCCCCRWHSIWHSQYSNIWLRYWRRRLWWLVVVMIWARSLLLQTHTIVGYKHKWGSRVLARTKCLVVNSLRLSERNRNAKEEEEDAKKSNFVHKFTYNMGKVLACTLPIFAVAFALFRLSLSLCFCCYCSTIWVFMFTLTEREREKKISAQHTQPHWNVWKFRCDSNTGCDSKNWMKNKI